MQIVVTDHKWAKFRAHGNIFCTSCKGSLLLVLTYRFTSKKIFEVVIHHHLKIQINYHKEFREENCLPEANCSTQPIFKRNVLLMFPVWIQLLFNSGTCSHCTVISR